MPRTRKTNTSQATGSSASSPRKATFRAREVRSRYGLKQTQMSRLLGISPRKLSELESHSSDPRPETRRRLTEMDRLHQALVEVMHPEDIAHWMLEPNDAFAGSTPLQLVERGEIDRLWQMIFTIRTGHPS